MVAAAAAAAATDPWAPLEWHKEVERTIGMKVSQHLETRICRELGRHFLCPHFEVGGHGEVSRVSVSSAALAAATAAVATSERGITRKLASQLVDVTQRDRTWITISEHRQVFEAVLAHGAQEDPCQRLPAHLRAADPLYRKEVGFEIAGSTLRGRVQDVLEPLAPRDGLAYFQERRYKVRYEDGTSENLSAEEVAELEPEEIPGVAKERAKVRLGCKTRTVRKQVLKKPCASKRR
eukprot:gnl/TRDRNA2_/TRDRNA2_43777_c0_seq1.p1 gnl/TRDRNA2_/TRDRNA2_43777_c0~~gnl/TRDRNA2_/TRDRNA2_43777_c0_seq1.p1  ORF type:complete len:266 (+),score=43.31 gnl/TRDRNA2_/TRDRNA2_43777_c0_seq1:93-800(+)